MSLKNSSVIVVTPIYEDAEASSRLFIELSDQFGVDIFVVAVDDGSLNQPVSPSMITAAGVDGVVLKLRRNVGHQRAIAIGLGYVSEYIFPQQRIVVMDSDGEDLPSTVPQLLKQLDSKSIDIAVAERKSRVETFRFKLFYYFYKRFFNLMTGRNISFGNFMVMKADAVRRLVSMQELSIHIAAAVIASKLRIAACPLDRGPRYAGQSKMNFVGLVLHGFKGLMVFAEDVLVRVGVASIFIAVLSMLGIAASVALKVVGFATPGWFSVALGILVLMLLQTGALSLMTLMLTGVVRGGSVTTNIDYKTFIEKVFEAKKG